jgi:transcriptional regulator with XRE-family HTH domain
MSSWNPRDLVLSPDRVREARERLGLSQSAFAEEINVVLRQSGREARCNKRLVQKWESGEHAVPVPRYQKALAQVTRRPFTLLCQEQAAGGVSPTARELDEISTEPGFLIQRLDKITAQISRSEP